MAADDGERARLREALAQMTARAELERLDKEEARRERDKLRAALERIVADRLDGSGRCKWCHVPIPGIGHCDGCPVDIARAALDAAAVASGATEGKERAP